MPTPAELRRQRPRGTGQRPAEPPGVEIPFGKKNYLIFGAAALVILAGYFFLSKGSITGAPILLLLGYLVLIPIGILAK
jgi:hypothetical protein